MDDLAVIHHQHLVAEFARGMEILFDQKDGGAAALDLGQAFDQRHHDRRRQALGRLVDQEQLARLDDGAGDGEHLLLSAGQEACARQPETPQRREESENPLQPRIVKRSVARRQHQVFLHREIGKHRHALRDITDAEPGDIRGRALLDALAVERYLAGGGLPQAHDGSQRRGLAGAVAAQQHRGLALGHAEIDALQNVIAPDMGMHAGEIKKVGHAALFPGAMPR